MLESKEIIDGFFLKQYYEKAYRNIQTIDDKEADHGYLLWKSTYFYGYVLSYSMAGYEKAEELVRKSLGLAKRRIDAKHPNDEDIKKIFNKFTQLNESSKLKENSTGLGLTITKEFVKLHGGSIKLSYNEQHCKCDYTGNK